MKVMIRNKSSMIALTKSGLGNLQKPIEEFISEGEVSGILLPRMLCLKWHEIFQSLKMSMK